MSASLSIRVRRSSRARLRNCPGQQPPRRVNPAGDASRPTRARQRSAKDFGRGHEPVSPFRQNADALRYLHPMRLSSGAWLVMIFLIVGEGAIAYLTVVEAGVGFGWAIAGFAAAAALTAGFFWAFARSEPGEKM